MATASAPGSPAGAAGSSHMPRSVRYARGLLWLQGGIWACGALLYAVWTLVTGISALAGHANFIHNGGALFLSAAVMTGGFAAAKFLLARSLAGRRERIRKTVIGVEMAMACLGALITAGAVDSSGGFLAGLFVCAGFVGGALSVAAALGLLRRPARQFFAQPGRACSPASDSNSNSSFSAPFSTTGRYLAVRPS
jgi:hypothetical protein